MKKINISYAVLENLGELENLVGKPVGISVWKGEPHKMVYRGVVDALLYGLPSEPIVEFLKQEYTTEKDFYPNIKDVRCVPTNLIQFIRVIKNDLRFLADRILIPKESITSNRFRIGFCDPSEEEYDERLKLLKLNEGMWEIPVKSKLADWSTVT
ncbi:hypothetical protein J4221_04375 [Candidatus Pacearchaeota archaeon]|nr:hypothetical protein [Candidatus Pacearchaeota archaeon]